MAKKPAKSTKPSTTEPRTLVTFLLDATQSMQKIKGSTLEAFNSYVSELKNSGASLDFTLITFNRSEIKKVHFETPIKDVPELTNDSYLPQAATPLIEASIKTIQALAAALPSKKNQPKIVVCIQTDGEENTSGLEYTWAALKSLIEEKKKAGWQFNFMGAGIDAYNQGAKMGMAVTDTMSYNSASPEATKSAFRGRATATALYASGASQDMWIGASEKMSAGDVYDPALRKDGQPFTTKPHVVPFVTSTIAPKRPVTPALDLTKPADTATLPTPDDLTL